MIGPEWSFRLPPGRIAQEPTRRRGESRLLVLDRDSGLIRHSKFRRLPGILRAGDLLVVNDSAVIPGRLPGRRATGGKVEVLLLEPVAAAGRPDTSRRQRWSCLLKPARRLRPGEPIRFTGFLTGVLVERRGEIWTIDLESTRPFPAVLNATGRTPLPPYIRRDREDPRDRRDRRRYQTVYAARRGSAAAPTAGLHFSHGILERLRKTGVERAAVTLHLGPASFLPARPGAGDIPPERYRLPEPTVRAIKRTRERGGRVIAVGTSTTRVLEDRAGSRGTVRAGEGLCRLFIRPGHRFRVVDGLLTNFHLPGSTHLLLVGALAGRVAVLDTYRRAVEEGYRFYSYGDAMLIL